MAVQLLLHKKLYRSNIFIIFILLNFTLLYISFVYYSSI